MLVICPFRANDFMRSSHETRVPTARRAPPGTAQAGGQGSSAPVKRAAPRGREGDRPRRGAESHADRIHGGTPFPVTSTPCCSRCAL